MLSYTIYGKRYMTQLQEQSEKLSLQALYQLPPPLLKPKFPNVTPPIKPGYWSMNGVRVAHAEVSNMMTGPLVTTHHFLM